MKRLPVVPFALVSMKSRLGLIVLSCWVLAGCDQNQPAVSRDAVVGSYIYKSSDPEGKSTDHEWDRMTLRIDGTYELVRGGSTRTKSVDTGDWLFTGGDDSQVMLGHVGYPVRMKAGEVRLMIDYDVGIWFAKTK